jgi:hypothetical protein
MFLGDLFLSILIRILKEPSALLTLVMGIFTWPGIAQAFWEYSL